MTRRVKREHGRIMSVETKVRGDALAEDAAAGATALIVGDAGDFDEDGGWLTINGQVVEYTEVDDDEGTITLANGLAGAAEAGDSVHVWSTLYDEVVDYQEALVELDGEYDNPEPVVAEVADGVPDLPEGDRGQAGESCTLLRVSDDEWEVVGVGGRARKSRGLRWEDDDVYTLTADDVANGSATIELSHEPMDEAVDAKWVGLGQPSSAYSVNGRTVTWPLGGFEQAGDLLTFHYTYLRGLPTVAAAWKFKEGLGSSTTYAATGFDDSGWRTSTGPFGWREAGYTRFTTEVKTTVSAPMDLWVRRDVTTDGTDLTIAVDVDDDASVYLDGALIATVSVTTNPAGDFSITVPASAGEHVIAVRATDQGNLGAGDNEGGYLNVKVTGGGL